MQKLGSKQANNLVLITSLVSGRVRLNLTMVIGSLLIERGNFCTQDGERGWRGGDDDYMRYTSLADLVI